MRLFELLILLSLAILAVSCLSRKAGHSAWFTRVASLSALLTAVHILVEQARWQLMPAYGLVLFFLFKSVLLLRRRRQDGKNFGAQTVVGRLGAVLGLLITALSLFLATGFPVHQLPEPAGPYPIGTAKFHIVDQDRPENHTADPGDVRSLLVHTWYPAELTDGHERAMWYPEADRIMPIAMQRAGLPGFTGTHFDIAESNSYVDAPISTAEPTFPVVLFSHGLTGMPYSTTALSEHLASHGYIVFSVAHTYWSVAATLPNGKFVGFDSVMTKTLDRFGKADLSAYFRQERAFLSDRTPPLSTADRLHLDSLLAGATRVPGDARRLWAADQKSVLDALERLEHPSPLARFSGRIDVERIGVAGYSFGGAAATELAATDPRIQAAVNIDGGLAGLWWSPISRKPYMFIGSSSISRTNITDMRHIGSAAPYYRVQVRGARHQNFGDNAHNSYLTRWTNLYGSIDRDRAIKLTTRYVLAFFDQHVRGIEQPLLQGDPAEPDVGLKVWPITR